MSDASEASPPAAEGAFSPVVSGAASLRAGLALTQERLSRLQSRLGRRGVVYLSRIPPYMSPQKLQSILSQYGTVTRMHIVEEDSSLHRNRVKRGGNRHKSFEEGWVEFSDRAVAREVAAQLNGHIIGGKKRSFYHDDIWSIKYLQGFQWEHLLEKLQYEKKVRRQRLRFEIAQRRKSDAAYLGQVDAAQQFEKMLERKGETAVRRDRVERTFHQTRPLEAEDVPIAKHHKFEPESESESA